jgi:hypothetical protein
LIEYFHKPFDSKEQFQTVDNRLNEVMLNSTFFALSGALVGLVLFKGKATRAATIGAFTAWYARGKMTD